MSEEEVKEERLIEQLDEVDTRPRWSYSQLSTYSACSEKWRLEKQVKPRLPSRQAPWFCLGLGIHGALERWEISDREADLIELFHDQYDEERTKAIEKEPNFSKWSNPGRRGLIEVLDDNRVKGATMMQKFLDQWNDPEFDWVVMHDEDGSPWVELPFKLDFGNLTVIGSIDAVSNGGVSVDYKTGQKKNAHPLQLGIYTVALEIQYGIPANGTAQFFFTKGAVDSRSTWGFSEHHDMSPYTKEYIQDVFQAAQRGVEAGVFLPNPSDLCDSFCDVKEFCREMGTPGRIIPLNWAEIPEDQRWWAPEIDSSANV